MAAGINLFAIFAQASGVEFDGAVMLLGCGEEAFVKWRAILRRTMAEFFRQVGVTDDLKQAGFRRACEQIKVNRPDFKRVALLPLGKFVGIINRPTFGDIVN